MSRFWDLWIQDTVLKLLKEKHLSADLAFCGALLSSLDWVVDLWFRVQAYRAGSCILDVGG